MKFITIFVILVNVNGYHLKDYTKLTKDTCFEAGDKIVKEIANYYDERNNNPQLQGWYTSTGELVAGFYC